MISITPNLFISTASLLLFVSGTPSTDRLLIKRNARPLLAESSDLALTTWETPLEGFFVRSHHDVMPSHVNDSWEISFTGLVDHPKSISVRNLKARNQVSFHAVLECSGNGRGRFTPQVAGNQWKKGAVGNAEWTGVRFEQITKELGIQPDAKFVTFEGFDEPVLKGDGKTKFVRSVPLALLFETKAILALEMNRQPLPLQHGGPVRVVMPGIYGQNWVKWVNKVTFSKNPDERMYAQKSYRMPNKQVMPGQAWDPVKDGHPIEYLKVQSIFTAPAPNAKLHAGPTVLRGKAFSGFGPIKKVEVSFDRGASWQMAQLSEPKDSAWQEFEIKADILNGTSYEAWSRATDGPGNVQPIDQEWNPKGYLYNAVDRLKFTGDAGGAALSEGETLASTHCQTCHSIDLAQGQRVDKGEWRKIIKKMVDYGLVLADADVEKIAHYFSHQYPPGLPSDDSAVIDVGIDPSSLVSSGSSVSSNGDRGKKLFGTHCSSCHGVNGEGKIGPKLKGRVITTATFWSSVISGKREMPPFKDRLTTKQIAEIRAWL